MTTQEKNTKEKILTTSIELFAKKGFDGTSIRDIASAAGVNLAAINYHFKNKENLYFSVFDYNYDWIKSHIEELGKKDLKTPDLAVGVYRFFISSGSAIMNTFKIFLSENISESGDHEFKKDRFGPPGQQVFLDTIKKDLGADIPQEGLEWAVKMIFSQLVHAGVVMNTAIMKERCQFDASLKPKNIENSIYHSVCAHLEYLKANAKLWEK